MTQLTETMQFYIKCSCWEISREVQPAYSWHAIPNTKCS